MTTHSDEYIYIALVHLLRYVHLYGFINGLVVIGLRLRVLLAADDGTAQPGSPPECSASVSKNHNTIYETPKSGKGGTNRLRVALGVSFTCTWSRYCLLLDGGKWDPSLCTSVINSNLVEHAREGDDGRIHSVGHGD